MNKKFNSSKGAVSTVLIVLVIALMVLVIVLFLVVRSAMIKNASEVPEDETSNELPKPVYETTIADARFVFESAYDFGNILASRDVRLQPHLTTTEKFIKVTIGAQNKGKVNIPQTSWDVGNIVDSDGRNFVSINDKAYFWLPRPDLCGALLKPEFDPVPCIKYYEVSKASKDLKIQVFYTPVNTSKKQESLVDLLVR